MHLIEYYRPPMTEFLGVLVHMIRKRKDDHNLGGREYVILSLHRFGCVLFYKVHDHIFLWSISLRSRIMTFQA